MATTHRPTARTVADRPDADRSDEVRAALIALGTGVGVLAVIAVATGLASVLAGHTAGLGGFVLLAGAWLAVVSASPAVATRLARRLAAADWAHRAPRSSRAVHAAVAYVLAR